MRSRWGFKYQSGYRREYLRVAPKTEEKIAEQYARWLAERDGISLKGANHITIEYIYDYENGPLVNRHYWNGTHEVRKTLKFVSGVRFERQTETHEWRGSRRRGGYWRVNHLEEIATIKIPNAGWHPKVQQWHYDENANLLLGADPESEAVTLAA